MSRSGRNGDSWLSSAMVIVGCISTAAIIVWLAVDVFILNPGDRGEIRRFNMRPADMDPKQFDFGLVESAKRVLPPEKYYQRYTYLVIGGLPLSFDKDEYQRRHRQDAVVIYDNNRGLAIFTKDYDNIFIWKWVRH